MVPFESLGTVSYLPSIVTMAVSVAVYEIFSVKEWCDLEYWVSWIRSRSLEMTAFDRSHTSSYSLFLYVFSPMQEYVVIISSLTEKKIGNGVTSIKHISVEV